jgi:phospholipid N-methyltransferase
VSVPPKKPSRGGKALLFARNFFRHPRMLGSLVPSSPFLIKRVLRRIDWGTARVIVEYGAGVGTFTSEILRRMRPDAILIAFETNDDFVRYLRDTLRVDVGALYTAPGSELFGHPHADLAGAGAMINIPY